MAKVNDGRNERITKVMNIRDDYLVAKYNTENADRLHEVLSLLLGNDLNANSALDEVFSEKRRTYYSESFPVAIQMCFAYNPDISSEQIISRLEKLNEECSFKNVFKVSPHYWQGLILGLLSSVSNALEVDSSNSGFTIKIFSLLHDIAISLDLTLSKQIIAGDKKWSNEIERLIKEIIHLCDFTTVKDILEVMPNYSGGLLPLYLKDIIFAKFFHSHSFDIRHEMMTLFLNAKCGDGKSLVS